MLSVRSSLKSWWPQARGGSEEKVSSPTGQRYPLGYNPRIDGLRGFSALSVAFAHFGVPGFTHGGYAVDIFFVLSGYLITRVLIDDRAEHRPLGTFYWRRWLRLMPALLALCLILALLTGSLLDAKALFKDSVASIFYIANWTRVYNAGAPLYLGNCWSLAIEEQFYLVWPILFKSFWKKKNDQALALVTLALIFACVGWRFWLKAQGADFGRYADGFDARVDGLLLGCLLALAAERPALREFLKTLAKLWPPAALTILLLFNWQGWDVNTALLINVASAIVILALVYRPRTYLGSALELKPLVTMGRISYGFYLWHNPIWIILKTHLVPTFYTALIGLPLTWLCAVVSYRLIERPALRLRYTKAWPTDRFGRAIAVMSLVGMIGASSYFFADPILQYYFPEPLKIVSYGPHDFKRGERFNVQPDGRSCGWLNMSHLAPLDIEVFMGQWNVPAVSAGDTIVICFPDALRQHVGKWDLRLTDFAGKLLAQPVPLEIKD